MNGKADTKARCINCHFFVRERRTIDGQTISLIAENDLRDKIRKGESIKALHSGLETWACHLGVWDEAAPDDTPRVDMKQIILNLDRSDFCFYWPYHQNMNLIAGKELQRREVANREASIDRGNALKGVRIAFWALVITSAIQLIVAAAMINTIKRAVFFSQPVQWLLHLVGIV